MLRKLFVILAAALAWVALPAVAQQPTASSKAKALPGANSAPYLLKSYSRMVTLDVVVEDRKGHHIRGLKASDFEVYEQTPSVSKKKRLQRIAEMQEIHTAALKPPPVVATGTTPGVYSNAVHVQKNPVPPTVLLVDGINTQVRYQAQVHEQMLKMLRQLPANVPVAVFLMGGRLRMLQGFTTDHAVLLKALAKAESATGQQLGHLDPKDDPDAAGNQMYGLDQLGSQAGAVTDQGLVQMIAAAQEFDQLLYSANMTERFTRTYDVFLSIARSLGGYPGRKNVLWLSTSFPLTMNAFMDQSDALIKDSDMGQQDYWKQMRVLDSALSDANIAVYPVDIGGVRGLQVYSAAARPANPYATKETWVDGRRVIGAASRQIEMRSIEQDTMQAIAKDTGGKVCAGNNDLAKCVAKAVNDSSDFYEISYYPNSGHWNGEYRRIFLKVKRHGARLSYRHGYYATPPGKPDPATQANEMQKDCGDLLNATAIAFSARTLASKTEGRLVFQLKIDPSALTFILAPNGEQILNLEVGVCTYNRRGWTQHLMAYPLSVGLGAKAYTTLVNGGHLLDAIYVPKPKPSAVRIIVKDIVSGKMGSIYIPTAELK